MGEDSIFLDEGLKYNCTGIDHVHVLSLSQRHLSHLPKECIAEFIHNLKEKLDWMYKRYIAISETNVDVLNSDVSNQIYQKSITNLRKNFPAANQNILKKLRAFTFNTGNVNQKVNIPKYFN